MNRLFLIVAASLFLTITAMNAHAAESSNSATITKVTVDPNLGTGAIWIETDTTETLSTCDSTATYVINMADAGDDLKYTHVMSGYLSGKTVIFGVTSCIPIYGTDFPKVQYVRVE